MPSITEGSYVRAQPRHIALHTSGTSPAHSGLNPGSLIALLARRAGYLEQLEPEGCCGAAHLGRFNCDGCELQAEHGTCCLEFERCVSCCIGAAGMDAVATVELALSMEACVGRCRTGSKSLDAKVWNRFRSEWKYCNGGSVSEQGQGLVGGVDAVA